MNAGEKFALRREETGVDATVDATMPLVSICIPSYKGAAFLPATIESVLQQSYARFELWVVDDASPDDTADVVARYADPRLRFVRNSRNLGPQGNWNRCLALATGKYYKLLPQDDLLAPGSLAEQVAILEDDVRHEIAVVFGSRLVIDHRGRRVFRRGLLAGRGRIDGRKLIRRCVGAGTNLIGEPGNGLMRRELALRLGSYDTEHPYMVDLDFWFRALAHGDGYYTAKRSSCFRISQGSWSVALGQKQFDDFQGFVAKYARDPSFGISRADMALGFTKARGNTLARGLIYRSMFRGQSATKVDHQEFDAHYAASQLARRSSGLRSRVKQFYLARVLRHVDGPTVDIGCGAGQLLEQLPAGSVGLEVNPVLVTALRARGLNVLQVPADERSISLGTLQPGSVRTAVLSHVLEHFDDAAGVLRRLLHECAALGIGRLIVVVPGRVGYGSDTTHKTFVTLDYLRSRGLLDEPGCVLSYRSFFPGNAAFIGDLFVYHELMLVYDMGAARDRDRTTRAARGGLIQFAKFVAVGILNTSFSYAIYAGLLRLGLNFALANLLSLVMGLGFSFKTQGTLVFGNSENRRILRFVAVWSVIYGFNVLLISRFLVMGFDPYVSGALSIPFSTVLSYLAQKFFVFRASAPPATTGPAQS